MQDDAPRIGDESLGSNAAAAVGVPDLPDCNVQCNYCNGEGIDPATGGTLDCRVAQVAQFDCATPYWAEAADDFMIPGRPQDACVVTRVTFWVTYINGGPPPQGVRGAFITIYEDGGGVPGGLPDLESVSCDLSAGPDFGAHVGAILGQEIVPPDQITIFDVSDSFPKLGTDNSGNVVPGSVERWDVELTQGITVPRGTPLWLGVAPSHITPPQSAVLLANTNSRYRAHRSLDGGDWTPIFGNINGCPNEDSVIGDFTDIAFVIGSESLPPQCCEDCGLIDGAVDIHDLDELIQQWGASGSCDCVADGEVDVEDLVAMILAWGPCFETPVNDQCDGTIDLGAFTGEIEIDLKAATPSPLGPVCTDSGGDVWYCIEANCFGLIKVRTTINVYVEIYEGCGCPPNLPAAGCGRGQTGAQVLVAPGQTYTIRLVNDQGLPDDYSLKGVMTISCGATSDCAHATRLPIGETADDDSCSSFGPLEAPPCGNQAGQIESGYWYIVQGNGTELTATLTALEGDDLAISVFCGACDDLDNATCIGACSTVAGEPCQTGDSPPSGSVSWCSREFDEYLIVIHAWETPKACGPYELRVTAGAQCDPATAPVCPGINEICLNAEESSCQLPSNMAQAIGFASDRAVGALVADRFLTGPEGLTFDEICWWGLYANVGGAPTDCSGAAPPDDYRVRVLADRAGLPGAELFSYTIAPGDLAKAARDSVDIFAIFSFSAPVPSTTLAADTCYWLEISNDLDGACRWFWKSGFGGDEEYAQTDNPDGTYEEGDLYPFYDLSWCLAASSGEALVLGDPNDCQSTGRCCDDGDCVLQLVDEATCQAVYGEWRRGEVCSDFTCPAAACTGDSVFQQRPYDDGEDGVAFAMSDQERSTRRYDDFVPNEDRAGDVTVTWHAVQLDLIDGVGFISLCDETSETTWQVNIYADDRGEPGALLCGVDAAGLILGAGDTYFGILTPKDPGIPSTIWQVTIPDCPVLEAGTRYWLSIMADNDPPVSDCVTGCCLNLIVESPEGNGTSRVEDVGAGSIAPSDADLNFCVNGTATAAP